MARTRLFLAVDLDAVVRRQIVVLQRTLADIAADVKWVEPDHLHVTVLFLGEVDDRDLAHLCRIVAKVAAATPSFPLSPAGLGAYPTLRRPKTLWTGLSEGAAELVALQAALVPPILDLGAFRQEERAYTPHLTLGRVNGEDAEAALAKELPKYADWKAGRTGVRDVTIYASEQRKTGPAYTVIGRAELAPD